jgi:hypothetical protein
MSGSYSSDLKKANRYQIVLLVIFNIVPLGIVLWRVGSLAEAEVRDVLTTSSVLLGITTATIVFFGQYVQNTTDFLFRKSNDLKKFKGVPENLRKALLGLIFLQYLLWWSLLTDGIATLLSLLAFYMKDVTIIGVIALSFMLMGILTLLLWMTLFILVNTPGKLTYDAIGENQQDSENNS